MIEHTIILIITFLLGTLMGSFASVLVQSFKESDTSYLTRRSHCTHTNKQLKWYHLIPLFSYIKQKGKSTYSGKPIGLHYFLSELICGLLFTIPYLYSLTVEVNFYLALSLYGLIFSAFLISYFDARYQEIPDAFTIVFALFAFLVGSASGLSVYHQLLAAGLYGSFFGIQYLVSKGKWIGSGDILLGLAIGLLLGWQKVLVALLVSYLLGSVVGIFILLKKQKETKTESYIAFGPFLLAGALISFFFGSKLIEFYFKLTLI